MTASKESADSTIWVPNVASSSQGACSSSCSSSFALASGFMRYPDTPTLIQLLVDDGFTQEQAEYGANQVW
jgi:hypothetical protein